MAKKYNTERYDILLQILRISGIFTCIWIYLIIYIYNQLHYIYVYIKNTITFIVYELILLSNFIYIYIYCKYIIYKFCAFCLLQHCRNTYTRWLHWFHIHIIFFCCFYQFSKSSFCSSWWTSNRFQTLKSSYWRCSIKNPVFKNLAILIGKVANLLQRVFNTVVFLWILRNF